MDFMRLGFQFQKESDEDEVKKGKFFGRLREASASGDGCDG